MIFRTYICTSLDDVQQQQMKRNFAIYKKIPKIKLSIRYNVSLRTVAVVFSMQFIYLQF